MMYFHLVADDPWIDPCDLCGQLAWGGGALAKFVPPDIVSKRLGELPGTCWHYRLCIPCAERADIYEAVKADILRTIVV